MQPEKLQQYFQQNKDQFQANSFEEAQQDVMQAYTAALWGGIVQQMKPAAEIEVRKEALAGSDTPQQQPAPQATPQ